MPTPPDNAVRAGRAQSRRILPRALVSLLVTITILAASALEPLEAGAQSPTRAVTNFSGLRLIDGRTGSASPATTVKNSKTASYVEPRAAFEFLTQGLGLSLGKSRDITGLRSGHTLRLTVGAPSALDLKLPVGATPPVGDTATLTINTVTQEETLTSSSPAGRVTVRIANAASAKLQVTGAVTERLPLFHTGVVLTGTVGDRDGRAIVSLSGRLGADARVAPDVVLEQGSKLVLLASGGVVVTGSASFGPAGRTVSAAVNGTISSTTDWTLDASLEGSAVGFLRGLRVGGDHTGTLSDAAGKVSYDLNTGASGTWDLTAGVKVTPRSLELSDRLPTSWTFTPPGVVQGTDWASVAGTVLVASASGALVTSGAVAFNLSSGQGLLNCDQTTPITLSSNRVKVVLEGASLTGHLRLGTGFAPEALAGTGMVWVPGPSGKHVFADATISVPAPGVLVVSFPLQLSLIGMGAPGTVATVLWSSRAVRGFPLGTGKTVDLPAGLSYISGGSALPAGAGGSQPAAGGTTTTTTPGTTSSPGTTTSTTSMAETTSTTSMTGTTSTTSMTGTTATTGTTGTATGSTTSTTTTNSTGPTTSTTGAAAGGTSTTSTTKPGSAPTSTTTTTGAAGTQPTGPAGTFTVSDAVQALLQDLGAKVSSAMLSGSVTGSTLTLTLGPPSLPFTLPAGIPVPQFGPATLSVDLSTHTLTLEASGTAGGVGATLNVVVSNAGTTTLADGADLTATVDLTGVPFLDGTTVSFQGSLTYSNGKLSASLAATLENDLTIAGNVVLMQGAMLTLDSDNGLSLSGTLEVGSGNAELDLVVTGTLKDLKNWSLSVSDPTAPMWQPVPALTLTPTFTGSVTDTDGTIRFDITTSNVNGAAALTWDVGAGAALSVTHLEVSDMAPPAGVSCPNGVNDGDIWVDLQGSFAYTPANLSLTAEGCLDLSAESFKIMTAAMGTLLPGNALFNIDSAALTATGNIEDDTFDVTATASLVITALSNQPTLPVGASFGSDGVIVGAQVPDLSSLGFSGSGAVYVATEKVDDFDPTTLGLTGDKFNLPAGLSLTLDYSLPGDVITAFQNIGIDLGDQASVHAVATLASDGFSIDLGFSFGSDADGAKVFSTNGFGLFLNSFDIDLLVGAQNQVTLSGSAFLEMPALIPGTVASSVEITVKGSFNFDSLDLTLGLSLSDWQNALGINGLQIGDLAGNIGITFETGIPTPTLSLSADNIVLPASWATAIGMVPGTQISFDADLDLDAPLLSFSIVGPDSQPALTPLALVSTDPNVVNSLVVNQASLVIAPTGGVTAAGDNVAPGISVIFDASIDNVKAHIDASVGLAPPSLDADVSVGSFSVGPVNIDNPMLHFHINPTKGIQMGFSGGFSAGDFSFNADVSLALGNSANGASISLSVTAGLPSWLQISGTLSGMVSGDGSGASVSASGSGYLVAGGNQLGPVSFSFDGSLSWADIANSFNQIAQFFNNAGMQVSQIVQILGNLGDDQQGIIDVLNAIGIDPTAVLQSVTSLFGLLNNSYNYIWVNPTAAQLYVLDVSGGSQSPNAPVIDYSWNGGYNQQWALVAGPIGYQIINRGSGQCLTVENNSTSAGTPLIQFPCNGGSNQLWSFSTTSTYNHQTISSVSSGLYVDVYGASFFEGATIDQYTYNGGSNQYFWFSPGTN
ncbi:MAG TPA: RICIN domain-containing protein [Acidimicrobiales bacterium]|nr:RICIN domain-containing protein [Acidimicrobiales bacterium]